MKASVKALLNQIIDHAGLFPPARLPMADALRTYLRDKESAPTAWMLGRFVCPAARLGELAAHAREYDNAALLRLTVLGQPGAPASDVMSQILADIRAIDEFRTGWTNGPLIDTYEVALPAYQALERSTVQTVQALLADAGLDGFLEIPRTPGWQSGFQTTCRALAGSQLGLKLRTGGLGADAFPDESAVAYFIHQCQLARVPWKATAGLHHPRRHWDQSLQVWHHGFLNVFGAGLLAAVHPLTQEDIAAILSDREARYFRFDDDGFAWKHWTCPTARIENLRTTSATTFGSCSFEEPCADLRAMGLL
ncbi:MAG: hypothetical protein HYX68_04495 [Planctomycetes bacterium]|nr:hypothetical protein [Planctomycetota bacterium]